MRRNNLYLIGLLLIGVTLLFLFFSHFPKKDSNSPEKDEIVHQKNTTNIPQKSISLEFSADDAEQELYTEHLIEIKNKTESFYNDFYSKRSKFNGSASCNEAVLIHDIDKKNYFIKIACSDKDTGLLVATSIYRDYNNDGEYTLGRMRDVGANAWHTYPPVSIEDANTMVREAYPEIVLEPIDSDLYHVNGKNPNYAFRTPDSDIIYLVDAENRNISTYTASNGTRDKDDPITDLIYMENGYLFVKLEAADLLSETDYLSLLKEVDESNAAISEGTLKLDKDFNVILDERQ